MYIYTYNDVCVYIIIYVYVSAGRHPQGAHNQIA